MTDRLKSLVAALCEGLDPATAAQIMESGSLSVDGMAIVLRPGDEHDPDGLSAYCDLGPLPEGEDGARAATRLLEINLALFRPGSIAFGVHAGSGHVMAMTRVDVARSTGATLRQALVELSAVGAAWQDTRFVDGSMTPPPPDPDALAAAVARLDEEGDNGSAPPSGPAFGRSSPFTRT